MGIWVRVREGAIVTQRRYDEADAQWRRGVRYVALPRVTWLDADHKRMEGNLNRLMLLSCVDKPEQCASMSFDGVCIGKAEITNAEFTADADGTLHRDAIAVHLFPAELCHPPVNQAFGTRIVDLSEDLLMQLFGTCRMPRDYLVQWNAQVQAAISRVRAAHSTALLMNEKQIEMLCQMGVVPLALFEPAPYGIREGAFESDANQEDIAAHNREMADEAMPFVMMDSGEAIPFIHPRTLTLSILTLCAALLATVAYANLCKPSSLSYPLEC